jgi:hypothetical protein
MSCFRVGEIADAKYNMGDDVSTVNDGSELIANKSASELSNLSSKIDMDTPYLQRMHMGNPESGI